MTKATPTPHLDALLASLRRRLSAQVWLHGLGTLLCVSGAWLVFAFVADRFLRVPRPVRVFHGVAWMGLVVYFTWRNLVRPLFSLPDRGGLAVLLERVHPELHERLTSAVQFRAGKGRAGDPLLVERVIGEADASARDLRVDGVLDESQPRARFVLGAAFAGLLVTLAVLNPLQSAIFFDRLWGGARAWPQRTVLTVDVPMEGPGVEVSRTEELLHVRVARGTDVPVVVHAEGDVPGEVTLHFEAGRDIVLGPPSGGTFRTLLRSCQEDVVFHATGGDDLDGLPHVAVQVLRPPDVEGIAYEIRPPAYSGLEPQVLFQRDVEVLAGTELRVHVLPYPEDAAGYALILPDERKLALVSAPFPTEPGVGDGVERALPGLAFDWRAERSIGFRVDLSDASGLSNPEPGLFRIRVVDDRPPEIQVLAPGRSEFEVVKGGAFPLRVRAQDDFGLVGVRWSVRRTADGGDEDPAAAGSFELVAVPESATDPDGRRERALGSVRIEVDDLGTPDEPVAVDQRFRIELTATDNRRPAAGEGRSLPLRARVVTADELLRRMQDRLGQARLAAVRLSDLQREKRRRVQELLEASDGDDARLHGEGLALAAAISGQRRVEVDAQALARDLAAVAEDVLYARVDEKAGALLEAHDARTALVADARFHAAPWRDLAAEQRAGDHGPAGFAGNLVELVDLALEVSEEHAADAAEALVRAEQVLDAGEVRRALAEASELQDRSLASIDDLLARLAEWDNFQNVLALARDILNRQKALRERTQQFASEK